MKRNYSKLQRGAERAAAAMTRLLESLSPGDARETLTAPLHEGKGAEADKVCEIVSDSHDDGGEALSNTAIGFTAESAVRRKLLRRVTDAVAAEALAPDRGDDLAAQPAEDGGGVAEICAAQAATGKENGVYGGDCEVIFGGAALHEESRDGVEEQQQEEDTRGEVSPARVDATSCEGAYARSARRAREPTKVAQHACR